MTELHSRSLTYKAPATLERTAQVVALPARTPPASACLIGSSKRMQQLRALIRRAASSRAPVLVLGPTGSGKELVVRMLHELGEHPEAPFIDVNCGAIPETLAESQLFGHRRGTFTNAVEDRDGFFGSVGRGTLFLDEIGELDLPLQKTLLRVLETGKYRALGDAAESTFAGRVVAATHVDLAARIEEKQFREDLYFRLNVLVLRVPSLEERREDIPELVEHFLSKLARKLELTPEAMALLEQARWPGNVRQLRNVIAWLDTFAEQEVVGEEEVAAALAQHERPREAKRSLELNELADLILGLPVEKKIEAIEAALIQRALEMTGGNKTKAGELLGLGRRQVERRLNTAL